MRNVDDERAPYRRPQSKIDPDEIRARAKQVVQDQRRLKVCFLLVKSYLLKISERNNSDK